MWQSIKEDIQVVFQRDPAVRSAWEVALAYPGFHAILMHRLVAEKNDLHIFFQNLKHLSR